MTDSWTPMAVDEVKLGDRVRLASGHEVLVSRIEPSFMGIETMVAFIEDPPAQWFKMPVQKSMQVEVQRATRTDDTAP
jgi:hypothetical protein